MSPQYSNRVEKVLERLRDVAEPDLLQCPLTQIEDTDERLWRLRVFCTPLLTGVHHPTAHYDKLDGQLSQLLSHPTRSSGKPSTLEPAITVSSVKVKGLLSRLPGTPQRRFWLPINNGVMKSEGTTLWDGIKSGRWASKYVVPEARSQLQIQSTDGPAPILNLLTRMQDTAWENMYVTKFVDFNSLAMAAIFANEGTNSNLNLARSSFNYVNLLSELFDEYQAMCDAVSFGVEAPFDDASDAGRALKDALFPQGRDDHEQALAVLKVFLWSAWQRSVMLHFYYVIGVQLTQGYSSTWNSLLAVRGIHELESMFKDEYRASSTEYMCSWAFETLRTGRTSVGLDFRQMISKFNSHFHSHPGRCIKGSTQSCEGGQPESCQRFTGAETAAQSAHTFLCDGDCTRIIWHASSYYNSPKPAAIVADSRSEILNYSFISSRTLAISHVWSHGQGGRPETGINSCLHQRYCHLAAQFECDSYWIDAAGIPSEITLRRQAIDSINNIFKSAKATLIIDADVQSINVSSPNPTIAEIETIVSTLLVCDWTVRGWTLLEGIRGSRSIFLLCKYDRVISLRETLITLHEYGAVDIAVLLGSAQHLIPHSDPSSSKTIEESGYLLSQRHTSWPQDVIICWSLLINAPVERRAVELWKKQTRVRTGYLLSSAARVDDVEGFGWATASPYIRPITRFVDLSDGRKQEYTVRFPPYDGDGSIYADITAEGLRGIWRIVDFDQSLLESARDLCCEMIYPPEAYEDDDMNFEAAEMVFAHPDDALAWYTIEALLSQGAQIRLVRALAEDGVSPYTGSSQRGENFGLVAAICASFDKGSTWQWKGVFSWQESENYEGWVVKEMLMV